MKTIRTMFTLALGAWVSGAAFAGNPDRAGSAGCTQLLVNPWARSGGWALSNSASVRGVEAMFGNVAGLARVRKTEVGFVQTKWWQGSGVTINTVGFGQKLGASSVLGIGATVFNYGDVLIRTENQPEGTGGSYRPNSANISLCYAKEFSNSIYGGIAVRVASESIANVRTSGFCFDAGIHYVTGATDNVHFGIALKNVGPPVRYSGDGLSVQGLLTSGSDQLTLEQRSERMELPSMMNIGAAYDFNFSEMHRLTAAANFASNSFTKDQYTIGLEYSFKKMLHLRGGYVYEKDVTDAEKSETVFTGPSAGLSVDFAFGEEKKSAIALDYAYRVTTPFDGVHQIGVRISL